jgi:methionyl-tRNA formyltransferase
VVYYKQEESSELRENDIDTSTIEGIIQNAFKIRKYFLYDTKLKNKTVLNINYGKPEKYATFNTKESVIETLKKNNINYFSVQAMSINDKEVIGAIGNAKPTYFVFGGGGILKKNILSVGKKFIHIHPGRIPYFRGSHCIEWSVLEEERCMASAIFMDEMIDGGELIDQCEFDYPKLENNNIAPLYSSHIRSELLIDIIKDYCENDKFNSSKQNASEGETYYKMHPALTNLVFHRLKE